MKKNLLNLGVVLTILAAIGLGCKFSAGTTTDDNTKNTAKPLANSNSGSNTTSTANSTTPTESKDTGKTARSPKEKADFTVTAEEYDKIFTRDGVTDKDLEKYGKKNIQVSGRVDMVVTEKKGTTQPWVTLYAPGTLHGVSCYFDDKDVDQMKDLKEDGMATVQGFQDDFLVPKVSPRLEHCQVIEVK